MNDVSIDALSRRASLMTLGAVGLAANLASPAITTAKKGGKKGKDKCKKQVGACREGVADLCEVVFGIDNVAECVALFGPCCDFLKGCNTAQAFACAVEVAQGLET
jgi:hypothetical protein